MLTLAKSGVKKPRLEMGSSLALALRLALKVMRAEGISSLLILSRRGRSARRLAVSVHFTTHSD